jgi:hypothetical protein
VKEAYEMDKFGFECERMDAESNATSISFFEQKASCSLNFELFHKFIDTSNEFIMQYIAISNFFFQFKFLASEGGITENVSMTLYIKPDVYITDMVLLTLLSLLCDILDKRG